MNENVSSGTRNGVRIVTWCWILLAVRDFLYVYDRLDDNYRIYARLLPDGHSWSGFFA